MLHSAGIDITVDLVATLIAGQFPQWVGLPIRPVISAGTVNATFRWARTWPCACRACRGGVDDVVTERRWLTRLAHFCSVAILTTMGKGHPRRGMPLDGALPNGTARTSGCMRT
jgi:aminoglycoside phosphotransferase (APT) family kinase protein